MNKISMIAANELIRLINQPVILLIMAILMAIAIINGIADATLLRGYTVSYDTFFSPGLANILYFNSLFMAALSMFIGVMSIEEDRKTGSLKLLLTKPVSRSDLIAGKLVGTIALLLMTATLCIMFGIAMLLVFYRGPVSITDAFLRIGVYIMLLFLNCALTAIITMAISIVLKNIFGTLICASSLFFFEWQVSLHGSVYDALGNLIYLNQRILYLTAIGTGNVDIFSTRTPIFTWLDYALPYILAMVAALFIVMSLSFFVFCRGDE